MNDSAPRPKRATITDVAAEAGVSRAAVSKVLQGGYGASANTRAKVNAAIEKLHYRPLLSARGLRSTNHTIGVTLPDTNNHFFYEVIRGAAEALEAEAYTLLIVPSGNDPQSDAHAMESLYDRQVDGILALSPSAAPEWLERQASIVPLVDLGRHDKSVAYDTVVGDDWHGAKLVLEHLVKLGHTRIAHVTQLDAVSYDGAHTPPRVRREVYEAFMRDHGVGDEIQVVTAKYAEAPAYEAVRELLRSGPLPTAIFAGNDDAGFGVLHALAEGGRRDIAVAAYDDSPLAAHPNMSLTSVNQEAKDMGALAVRLLLERIAGRTDSRHEVIRPRLMVRESSFAPGR